MALMGLLMECKRYAATVEYTSQDLKGKKVTYQALRNAPVFVYLVRHFPEIFLAVIPIAQI